MEIFTEKAEAWSLLKKRSSITHLKHFSLSLRHLCCAAAGSIFVKNAFWLPLPLVGKYFAPAGYFRKTL